MKETKNDIIKNNGLVQTLSYTKIIKDKYKIIWEIPMTYY